MEMEPVAPAPTPGAALLRRYLVINRSAQDSLRAWHDHFETVVFAPLRSCVRTVARRHSLLKEAKLALPEYRRTATEEVLQPIARQMALLPFAQAFDGGAQLIADLQAAAELVRGTIKGIPRRRGIKTHPVEVPIAYLLLRRVDITIAGQASVAQDHLEHHCRAVVGELERGLTAWTYGILRLEHTANAPDGNLQIGKAPLAATEQASAAAIFGELVAAMQDMLAGVAASSIEAHQSITSPKDGALTEGSALADIRLKKHAGSAALDRMVTRKARAVKWLAEAQTRIDLNLRLASLRATLVEEQRHLLETTAAATLGPIKQAMESAVSILNSQPDLITDLSSEALVRHIRALKTSVLEPVRSTLTDIPGFIAAEHALSHPGEYQWAVVSDVVSAWPSVAELHSPTNGGTERRFLRRELVVVLGPFPERLAARAQPLRRKLLTIWNTPERMVGIIEFSLVTALSELEGGALESASNARELIRSGLQQAARRLHDLQHSLNAPWNEFARAVEQLFHNDWANILRSLQPEANLENRSVALRLHLLRQIRLIGKYLQRVVENLAQGGSGLLVRGRTRAGALIEQGRSAIGVTAAQESDRLRTIELLAPGTLQDLYDHLPLVYSRLFTLEPVTEVWQLEGRQQDMPYLQQHVLNWRARQASAALVLPMTSGSGRSSLLGAVAAQLEGRVHLIPLRERILSEENLALLIAGAVGLHAATLQELEEQLFKGPSRVCLLDGLEHLILRTESGTNVMERVLSLFARTDSRICWIATIGDVAWQYLQRALETRCRIASTHHCQSVGRGVLEGIIQGRHDRSGMDLYFERPETISALLGRRLERARSEDVRQALLRNNFFDRLHAQSGSNVALAIVRWLRAASFEANRVTIRTEAPLSFRFLESLDLAQSFSLHAFLLHHTLTVEEHARVLGSSGATVMESLLNMHLIIPSNARWYRHHEASNSIVAGDRYRLHPLVTHPVGVHLREQNILHS